MNCSSEGDQLLFRDGAAHTASLAAVWRWIAGITFSVIQLHRAPPKPLVRPIVAGIEERAEIADLVAEGEQIVDDFVGSAPDHDLIDDDCGVTVESGAVWSALKRFARPLRTSFVATVIAIALPVIAGSFRTEAAISLVRFRSLD
jgi:hypothetical protein